jgi:hypothetical protein
LSLCFCVMLSCAGRGVCSGLIAREESSGACLNKIENLKPRSGNRSPAEI